MKVLQRGSNSPSPLIAPVNGDYFNFQIEAQHIVKGKRGQKVYACDLCSAPGSQFKRSFSLKRHYLRFHINFAFLSPRDLSNCAIATNGKLQKNGYSSNQLDGKVGKIPLVYRCHKCGSLVKTKDDLISHLETHQPSNVDDNTIDGEKRGKNRCPRCSTAFSLRKTLMRHIKKNRCRGMASSPVDSSKSETDANDTENSSVVKTADELEDDEIEISMQLCPSSLFRFACILCAKLFDSYVNMCRHRRLAHGRYGVCSPQRLLTRKVFQASPEISNSSRLLATSSQDYDKFIDNAYDNAALFIEGKISTATESADVEVLAAHDEEEKSIILTSRWSWGKIDYNIEEIHKLDIPVQKAFYFGLGSWRNQHEVGQEEKAKEDVFSYLNLCAKKQEEMVEAEVPELSGEWIRLKSYICLPCGQKYVDFYKLLDHQHSNHAGVWCSHIQLDQEWETVDLVKELTKELNRSGNGQSSVDSYECKKCHFKVDSVAELHSHILLCSNHSTPKKRLSRSNSNNKRTTVNGRRRGMLRQFLRSSALNNANEHKEESKERVKVVTRQLKKDLVNKKSKKEQLVSKKSGILTGIHQCLSCKKKLKSQPSLLKHQNYCRKKEKKEKKELDDTKKKSKVKKILPPKSSKVETPENGSSRPVRSNRAVSEDVIELSFLEALSSEQRKHVSENTCPFCLKHYTYKSYFRKHLIEGCNSDVNLSSPKSSVVKKSKETPKAQKKKAPAKKRETKAKKIHERQTKKTARTI